MDLAEQQQHKINPFHALVTCSSQGCRLFKCLHCNSNFSAKRVYDKRQIENHIDYCYAASLHAAELEIAARMTTAAEEPDEELDFDCGDEDSFVNQEEPNKRHRSIIRRTIAKAKPADSSIHSIDPIDMTFDIGTDVMDIFTDNNGFENEAVELLLECQQYLAVENDDITYTAISDKEVTTNDSPTGDATGESAVDESELKDLVNELFPETNRHNKK